VQLKFTTQDVGEIGDGYWAGCGYRGCQGNGSMMILKSWLALKLEFWRVGLLINFPHALTSALNFEDFIFDAACTFYIEYYMYV
jgi:hypothetical protein